MDEELLEVVEWLVDVVLETTIQQQVSWLAIQSSSPRLNSAIHAIESQ